jgi:DNA-binding transcriptional LysR family regulator
VADHFAEPWVARGELTPVLPDWNLPSSPAWAVFPGRRLMPARTRAFLDALAAEFVGPRCTEYHEKLARMRRDAAA